MMLSFSRFEVRDADSSLRDVNLVPTRLYVGSKSKRCSEPRPGTNRRRSIDLAARFNDCFSESAFKSVCCDCLRRHYPHSFQLRLKGLQKFSE